MANKNEFGLDAPLTMEVIPRPVKTYHTKSYDRISLANSGFEGKGKTVFITGGATGIGRAIATAFAKANIARLAVLSRSPAPLAKLKSDFATQFPSLEVLTFSASITDHAAVTSALHTVAAIDVLVHCATATNILVAPRDVPTAAIQDIFDTNVVGPHHLLATFTRMPDPAPGRGKTFINISSAAAHLTLPLQMAYATTKAAFAKMVAYFDLDEGVRAAETGAAATAAARARLFTIHPGAFYTDLAAKYVKEDFMQWEDLSLPADYCVWLAGPQSDFLVGRFVWPHWDVEEMVALKGRMEKEPDFLTLGLIQ